MKSVQGGTIPLTHPPLAAACLVRASIIFKSELNAEKRKERTLTNRLLRNQW
jgi:hypothetical protein